MKKVNGTPKIAEQPGPSTVQKGNGATEYRTPVVEQRLQTNDRWPALASEEEEKKNKQSKRMEQRVKRLRSLRHTVNYMSAKKNFT